MDGRLGQSVVIKRLRDQVAQYEANLVRVKELLAKADARLRAANEDRRKWGRVVTNLEASLDEARARLERARVELRMAEQQAESGIQPPQAKPEVAVSPAAPSSDYGTSLSDSSLSLLKGLMQRPMQELAQVPLEEMVLIEAALPEEEVLEKTEDGRRLLGRIELVNQTRESPEERFDPAGEDRRRQVVLRAAIDKLQKNQVDKMTPEEIRMTLVCHTLLSRRLNPSIRDQHLLRILSAAINVLRRKNTEFTRIANEVI